MNELDLMLKRNKEFAAPMPSLPQSLQTVKALIIGCADMRVDPSHVLGIKPGEAVVIRNIGGRITQHCWSSWGCSDESEKLPERFRRTAASFTSSYFTTPIAASPASWATPLCSQTIFRFRKRTLRPKQSSTRAKP